MSYQVMRRHRWYLPRHCFSIFVLASICSAIVVPNSFGQEAATDQATADQTTQDAKESETKDDKPKIDPGQADLDEAVIARIDAESMKQLESVAALLESSIAKGLSSENSAFAKQMLASVLLQQSQLTVNQMMRSRGRRQATLREDALDKLDAAVKHDPNLVEAYLLIARMNLLPNGDKDAITEATSKAIELLKNDPSERSAALVLRALTYDREDDDKRAADLDEAIQADKENVDAFQARAALRLRTDDIDGAVKDLKAILELDPTNQRVAEEAVTKLVDANRVDDALELITKALEAKPSEGLYRMRAILYRMQRKEDQALADLNKAIAMQPRDPIALLQRAELALDRKDVKSAKSDLRSATRLAPRIENTETAVIVRCRIAIEEGRMADAIFDMKMLADRDPSNTLRQSQLANLYLSDNRPRKAIESLTNVLDQEAENIGALRSRGDAYLAVGEHKNAIKDYERAIKVVDDGKDDEYDLSGILNNLAWVLATSPNDSVRNGKRSVELGERAVKLTEEKEAHILSTLAAGYAEVGDFEKAIQWSTKCVELGKAEEHDQLDQLQKELDSYKAGKPWREKQETEENAVPIISKEDLIDT